MTSIDDPEECDDYLTQINDTFHRGVEKSGMKYLHQLKNACLADNDLSDYKFEVSTFFRKLLAFAEKKGVDILSNISIADFDQFGFPIQNEQCFSGLMTAINDNDYILGRSPSVEVGDEKYAEDEFEDEDETEDISELCNSQSKSGEVIVEDWEDAGNFIPSPSAEPKMFDQQHLRGHSAVGVGAKGVSIADAKPSAAVTRDRKDVPVAMRSSSGGKRKNPSWITDKKWTLSDKIGEGAFGEVFKCLDNMVHETLNTLNILNKPNEILLQYI